MTEEYQFIPCLTDDEKLFAEDNDAALERLLEILAELQSGIVTLDIQHGKLIAANVTKREHFVG